MILNIIKKNMKKSGKNILYLAIFVLIIVFIILIGIIINLSNANKIENNEKFKKEQLGEITTNNTYILMQTHTSEVQEKEQKLVLFKSAIASAITEMGVETSEDADVDTMANNIKNISGSSTILYSSGKLTAPDFNWYEVDLGFKPNMLIIDCYERPYGSTTYSYYMSLYYSEHRKAIDSRYIILTDTGFKYNMVEASFVNGYFLYAASGISE